jgi:hypothetical protein
MSYTHILDELKSALKKLGIFGFHVFSDLFPGIPGIPGE